MDSNYHLGLLAFRLKNFSFCLHWKVFLPFFFFDKVLLVRKFFFSTLNMLFHCILAFMIYVEKKAVNFTGRGFPSKSQVISSLLPSKFSPYFDSLHFYYDASFVDILELILLRITEFPDVFRLAFFSKLGKFSTTHSLDFSPSFLSWLPLCICWCFFWGSVHCSFVFPSVPQLEFLYWSIFKFANSFLSVYCGVSLVNF